MKLETLIFIILICIVILLFIIIYNNNDKILNVQNALNILESFQPQLQPVITFKTICGNIVTLSNNKVPFSNADDYHIIVISNVPTELYNSSKITISFMSQNGIDEQEYTGVELESIKGTSGANTYTINQTLQENTKYILKISAKDVVQEIKYQFTTDYNIFTYNPKPAAVTITTNSVASKYLVIGIKKQSDPTYVYQLADTDTSVLNTPDGNYTYNLEIPNFNTYIAEVLTKLKADNNDCIESEYNELTKYIPYKFDAQLTVNRMKDPYPLENVIVPTINCIPKNNCSVTLRNLRKNTEYKIKIRLIYFKSGSIANYRSSPMVQWPFNTGESGDNFFETIDQINKLLATVKNANINADLFNKEQELQNNRLSTIENDFTSKIQPLFS